MRRAVKLLFVNALADPCDNINYSVTSFSGSQVEFYKEIFTLYVTAVMNHTYSNQNFDGSSLIDCLNSSQHSNCAHYELLAALKKEPLTVLVSAVRVRLYTRRCAAVSKSCGQNGRHAGNTLCNTVARPVELRQRDGQIAVNRSTNYR